MTAPVFLALVLTASQPPTVAPLLKDNRFDEALTAAVAASNAATTTLGPAHPGALAATHKRGKLQLLMGRPKDAAGVLAAAVATWAGRPDPPHAVYARLLNDLGVARFQLAEYEPARSLFDRALAVWTKVNGEAHADTLQAMRNLAFAEDELGRLDEAKKRFTACQKLLKNAMDAPTLTLPSASEAVLVPHARISYPWLYAIPSTEFAFPPVGVVTACRADMAPLADALGRLLVMELMTSYKLPPTYGPKVIELATDAYGPADYRTAVARAIDVAARRDKANYSVEELPTPFGPDHPLRAILLRNRAEVRSSGRLTGGQTDAVGAIRIRQNLFGRKHPTTADAIDVYALVRHRAGGHQEATGSLDEVVSIRTATLGPDHPLTARAVVTNGVVAFEASDYPRSRRLLEAAERNPHTRTAAATSLGVVLRQQGDYPAARGILERAVAEARARSGRDWGTRAAELNLCAVQIDLGELTAPEVVYRAVLADPKADFGDVRQARLGLAAIARVRKDLPLAAKLYEEVVAANPSDMLALQTLGAVRREQGDYAAAETHIRNVLTASLARTDGDRHPDTAFVRLSLGLLFQAKGDPAAAVPEFEQALKIYQSQQGASSRKTADTLKHLGTAKLLAGDLAGPRAALEEAIRVKAAWGKDVLPNVSEADAVSFVASLGELDPLLSAYRLDPAVPAATAYEAVWATRGTATRAITAGRRVPVDSPATARLLDKLRAARATLTTLLRDRDSAWGFRPPATGSSCRPFSPRSRHRTGRRFSSAASTTPTRRPPLRRPASTADPSPGRLGARGRICRGARRKSMPSRRCGRVVRRR